MPRLLSNIVPRRLNFMAQSIFNSNDNILCKIDIITRWSQLFKMHRVEVHNGIKYIIAIFQYLQLWDVKDENNCRKRVKKFLLLFFASYPVSLGVGAVKTQNNEETVYLAAGAILNGIQLVRLYYIIWGRSEIFTFIHNASSYAVDDEHFSQIDEKLKKFVKFVKYLLLIILIALASTFSFEAVSGEKTLPCNIAFPLDWKNSDIGYWMAFLFLLIQAAFSCVIFLFTIIIWYVMLGFAIQYELLGNQLRRMGTTIRPTKLSKAEKQNLFLREITAGAKTYQKIRENISHFVSYFSNLFFIQIVTSSMGLCGMVYTLAFISIGNVFECLLYIACVVYCIFDIFMIMYLGNEIKLSSDRLSYCLFECNWLEQSYSCKKFIITLAEIVKQPHELVIVIYPLNLETFSRIVKLAYNMFNILQNLN